MFYLHYILIFYSLEHFVKRPINQHQQTCAKDVCLVCLEQYVKLFSFVSLIKF